jgi:hypothetical protein
MLPICDGAAGPQPPPPPRQPPQQPELDEVMLGSEMLKLVKNPGDGRTMLMNVTQRQWTVVGQPGEDVTFLAKHSHHMALCVIDSRSGFRLDSGLANFMRTTIENNQWISLSQSHDQSATPAAPAVPKADVSAVPIASRSGGQLNQQFVQTGRLIAMHEPGGTTMPVPIEPFQRVHDGQQV